MGKEFEKAKKKLEGLNNQLQTLKEIRDDVTEEKMKLQREWYGITDGEGLSIFMFEGIVKAIKRWVK